jgi:hypothetical protein
MSEALPHQSARDDDPDAELFLAFVAGFDASAEGFNGEYVSECHNVPDEGHVHDDEFFDQLRREFDEWKARAYGS